MEKQTKWYLKTSVLIIALFCVGPLALPLMWCNPRFSKNSKIITTTIVAALTFWLAIASMQAARVLTEYYGLMFQ
ncbi:hypothetical protein ACFL1E_00275 [Candidatus Omnitrophota bacterium]